MSPALLEPDAAAVAARMLAQARTDRVPVVPCGGRTKLQWGGTSAPGAAFFSMRRLTAPFRHDAGDLVAMLPAGMTLADANAHLAREGQWLPIDPPHAERSTIGGIVAANASGPRRHKHGAPRDLIIGIEVALADGRLVKAGGRVVKNVAGYDLSRLFCGSFGSLGVITSATFKLSPLPAASRTVVARVPTQVRALELAAELATAPMTPSTIEVEAPGPTLLVRFETTARAADRMADAARVLLTSGGASVDIATGETESTAWREHEAVIWDRPGTIVKISMLPADVGGVLRELDRMRATLDWSLAGRVAIGVLLVRMDGDPFRIADAIATLRSVVGKRGHIAWLRGQDDVRVRAGNGHMSSVSQTLMRAVKHQFDPDGILPGIPGIPDPRV